MEENLKWGEEGQKNVTIPLPLDKLRRGKSGVVPMFDNINIGRYAIEMENTG